MQDKNLVRKNATMDASVKMDIHEARILFDVFHKRDIVSAPFWYFLRSESHKSFHFQLMSYVLTTTDITELQLDTTMILANIDF